MKEKINHFLAYLKSTFSEADGTGSASRLLAGLGVMMTLVWVSYLVFTQHHLPDLSGASLFMSASFSGYGANKVCKIIQSSQK